MDVYRTEEEQLAAIQGWWRDNYKIILAAIVTLILAKIFEAPAQPQGRAWDFRLNLLAVGLLGVFGIVTAIVVYGFGWRL